MSTNVGVDIALQAGLCTNQSVPTRRNLNADLTVFAELADASHLTQARDVGIRKLLLPRSGVNVASFAFGLSDPARSALCRTVNRDGLLKSV